MDVNPVVLIGLRHQIEQFGSLRYQVLKLLVEEFRPTIRTCHKHLMFRVLRMLRVLLMLRMFPTFRVLLTLHILPMLLMLRMVRVFRVPRTLRIFHSLRPLRMRPELCIIFKLQIALNLLFIKSPFIIKGDFLLMNLLRLFLRRYRLALFHMTRQSRRLRHLVILRMMRILMDLLVVVVVVVEVILLVVVVEMVIRLVVVVVEIRQATVMVVVEVILLVSRRVILETSPTGVFHPV